MKQTSDALGYANILLLGEIFNENLWIKVIAGQHMVRVLDLIV